MLKTKGLRIISDIHYDSGINKESFESTFNNAFNKSKGIVTLIAGDLAANLKNEKEFLEKYFNNKLVFFTEGNHMVYCRSLKTIYELEEERKKEFPLTHPFWKYLNNNWDWIPGTNESIAIIGSIFYTDYEYHTWTVDSFNEYLNAWTVMGKAYGLNYEEEKVTSLDINRIIEENQFIAQSYLNDFNWGYEAPGKNLTPYTYRELHLKSKKEVLRCYNEIIVKNPKAKVILMTHHCL